MYKKNFLGCCGAFRRSFELMPGQYTGPNGLYSAAYYGETALRLSVAVSVIGCYCFSDFSLVYGLAR